jgi:hypothetical protein
MGGRGTSAALVTDQLVNPVAGMIVTLAVTSGGGSVTPNTVTTGSHGVAAVTTWTMGLGPGQNTLTATAAPSGISGNPGTFVATATLLWDSRQPSTACWLGPC